MEAHKKRRIAWLPMAVAAFLVFIAAVIAVGSPAMAHLFNDLWNDHVELEKQKQHQTFKKSHEDLVREHDSRSKKAFETLALAYVPDPAISKALDTFKADLSRELEDSYNVIMSDAGAVPMDPRIVQIMHYWFKERLPREVVEYFRHQNAPPLIVKIAFPSELLTPVTPAQYNTCAHLILININSAADSGMLALRVLYATESDEVGGTLTLGHELGHAYDSLKARIDRPGDFNCGENSKAFVSSFDNDYAGIVAKEKPITDRVHHPNSEPIREDFAEGFKWFLIATAQLRNEYPKRYSYLRNSVFCGKYIKAEAALGKERYTDIDYGEDYERVAPLESLLRKEVGPITLCER